MANDYVWEARFTPVAGTLDLQDYIDYLTDLDAGEPIVASLDIDGHDYWVALEYGTSPRTSDPGPHANDAVPLSLPARIPSSKRHSEWYLISPRNKKGISYIGRDGKRVVRPFVHHPGILGRGTIRRMLAVLLTELAIALDEFDAEDTLPTRRELVDLVNGFISALFNAVYEASLHHDAYYHSDARETTSLADAWSVTRALVGRNRKGFD